MPHSSARLLCSLALSSILAATPARAGDTVLYGPAPAWVEPRDLALNTGETDKPLVLIDEQARIEQGLLTTYNELAIALDTPQALTQFGTLSANWLPDKGDLTIHRVELVRADGTVDLIAQGAQFEVLRREINLESRMLDGALTATLNLRGARLGDVVRLAYSATLNDQALGEDVQWQAMLLEETVPLREGYVTVSWPESLAVSRLHLGDAPVADPLLKDGYYTWSSAMPVAKAAEMPADAPLRYRMPELLQVTTYRDWAQVSRDMAAHYRTDAAITPGGALAGEVARIAAASADPLERAALALRVVQDDVSYLLNGLDGGNYLPQAPEETWEIRSGDCKAKSLLLLSMLRGLGIEAEAALVRTEGGDVLPGALPMPGNFDHIIVRAEIGGMTYWLDGTNGGTRLDTMDIVPRFFHALPLRDAGSGLVKLEERAQATPDRISRVTYDQSAGIRVPGLFDIEVELHGPTGFPWRYVAQQADKDVIKGAVYELVSGIMGEALLVDEKVTYDAQGGVALVSARGLQTSPWQRDRLDYAFTPPAQVAKSVNFDSDRARREWRDIPVNLHGPIHFQSQLEVRLPPGAGGFELKGKEALEQTIGGVDLASTARFEGDRFVLDQRMRSILEELPADQISTAKRDLIRFDRALPVLRSTGPVRELWDYFGEARQSLAPIEALYAGALREAEPDDPAPFLNRARFLMGIYDKAGALRDVEAAHAIVSTRETFALLGYLRQETGDLPGALEALRTAEELEPNGSTFWQQVELLGLTGASEEGVFLAEEYPQLVDDPVAEANIMAVALGWNGKASEGLARLTELAARRPGDGTLLNHICWHAGTWDLMTAELLQSCVAAVEKSEYSAAALDSRALAHLRMGDLDAALTDIDAALLAEPAQVESRLLRGIILAAQGKRKPGRADIDLALAMSPALGPRYRAWGFEF